MTVDSIEHWRERAETAERERDEARAERNEATRLLLKMQDANELNFARCKTLGEELEAERAEAARRYSGEQDRRLVAEQQAAKARAELEVERAETKRFADAAAALAAQTVRAEAARDAALAQVEEFKRQMEARR